MSRRAASITQNPVSDLASGPCSIVSGPDDAPWLTMVHSGEIAWLAVDGRFDRYPLDSASCGPAVITPGAG
jgi:virginiamycin B lyase